MKKWSEEEMRFLKDNYKYNSYTSISKELNRSIGAIYWKAFEMGLKKGRWDKYNRLNKDKIINMLIDYSKKLGKSPSVREIPIALKSGCQRHFGNFNNAKKAANLETKELIRSLQHFNSDAKIICQDINGKKIGDVYQIAISNTVRLIIKNKQDT